MIASFHTLCIIAHYVYVVLRDTLSARFQSYAINYNDPLTFKGGKYLISSECYIEEGFGPRFVPQLFVQRYLTVKGALEDEEWKGSIRKIVEFGCAELGFFLYLKKLAGAQEVLEVDVDHEVLVKNYCKVSPLNSDYLFQRNEPLTVFVLEGNIAHTDECLEGCDAVVCIELIEHLYPDVLEEVPYTVFGCIKPRVAIFTTPNVEFNVLFPNSEGFRHPDHKFEWTRAQFKSWGNNIVLRYPDYKVSFHGIGWGPHGTENVGACSQMAVFQRHSSTTNDKSSIEDARIHSTEHKYQLLRKNEYPFHVDTRSQKQKILDQLEYSLQMLSTSEEFMENSQILIPVLRLLPFVKQWNTSEKEVQDLLKEAGWNIHDQQSGNVVVFPEYESSISEDPVECVTYEGTYNETQEHHRVENWDDYSLDASSEKWDCDSLDQNIQSGASWNNSWSKQNEPSWTLSSVKENDEYREESVPSTSGHNLVNEVCSSTTSDNVKTFIDDKNATDYELPCGVDIASKHTNVSDNSRAQIIEEIENSIPLFISASDKSESTKMKSEEEVENCDEQILSRNVIANSSSSFLSNNITQPLLISQDSSERTTNNVLVEAYHQTDAPLRFLKSSPSSNLYLNLQAEAQGTNFETNKKLEGFTDSPAAGSISLEEPNDRLADSGYPNSNSAQDMDLDLTPEQVDELFTENDAVTDHPHDHHSDSVSVSSRDSDSVNEPQPLPQPLPLVMPQPDVLFEEAMNVENGDVANNNRDGEGNNVVAVRALLNEGGNDVGDDNAGAMGIVLPENLDDLIPLFAAAEDIDNDNEVEINVEPFPPWLLNMLGLANGGGAIGGRGVNEEEQSDHEHESSEDEDEDSDNNPVIDEGLGDEFNLDSSSLSDTCPSDLGLESDVGGEVAVANS
ncbi:Small RNA 2'-O-methyltransferase [Gryllus bimaculatus]|nr:Small RNA 2'-O-methyltransferase [Gryllus bimaculatus]